MKKLSIFLFVTFLIFSFPKEIKANNPAYMQGYFYSNLTPYGTWISLDFGVYAWRPTIITRTWAPYKIGRWIWSDYGWYWDSYEPFGFIVYHYGRWHYDDYYGWIWIPDYDWAPAWVEWRYDDYYIGWAPLPPYAVFRISIGIVYTYSYVIPVTHWHFVQFRHFGNAYVYNYYVPERIKYRIHSNTKYRNEYRYSDGRIRNEGVDFDFVRKRAGDEIRKRDLLITDDPRNFENSRKRDRDQITTFIADRDRILTDRESLRNVEVVRNDRRTSLDLSRVELGETRNRDEQVRSRESENVISRNIKRESRQERNDNQRDIERKESERRDFDRRESERRDFERREFERRNNQVFEQRRNENLEQRRNETRENEINRQNERNRVIEEQNRQIQQMERRNNNQIFPNTDQQRHSRNIEERRIEQNNNQRNDNREVRTQQRNDDYRNENRREDVNRNREQNTEQRQRTR